MDLFEPTRQAFALLFTGDAKLWGIIWISLWVALAAIALIAPFAIGAGFALAKLKFAGRRVIIVLLQALLSFPTVVIALVLYLLLSRRGPFGAFELLFTPWAIMIGYIIIALPILIVFTVSAVQGGDPRIFETARCLGARVYPHAQGAVEVGYFPVEATREGRAVCAAARGRACSVWWWEPVPLWQSWWRCVRCPARRPPDWRRRSSWWRRRRSG